MSETRLREGGFEYVFADGVPAEKYDAWSHVRNRFSRTCGGAKSVDLICLNQTTLWLIEVKDYRSQTRTKPSTLQQEVAEKVRDTLAGLISARLYADEPNEQSSADTFLACKRIRVALHLEQPNARSGARPRPINPASVLQELKRLIKWIDSHPVVFCRSNTGPHLPFSVVTI